MAANNLAAIYTKIRRLLRSPSEAQITSSQIKEYVNTVILYIMPELLELVSMRKTFSFYTTPNVDQYSTNTLNTNDPMYNFKNSVITTRTPVYIAGIRAPFTQERSQFFAQWPQAQFKTTIGTGDDIEDSFSGTLSLIPVLPRSVLFSSIDIVGTGQSLVDVPLVSDDSGEEGTELTIGNLYDPRGEIPTAPTVEDLSNEIDYVTGEYTVTFTSPPRSGESVYVQTVPYTASRPQSVLFFDNTFTVRPVPDDTYEVKVEAYIRPSELDETTDVPELEQWWLFIACYAAKLIAEDRTDFELAASLNQLVEENKKLVNRRSLKELEKQPIRTMYDRLPLMGYTSRPWSSNIF
jgi:hypothetical protein